MSDALLVLNAGSSSLKFSLFGLTGGAAPARLLEGQVDGLPEAPRLAAKDAAGATLAERALGATAADPRGAMAVMGAFLREHLGQERLVAAGHRVVHGGLRYERPVRIDDEVMRELDRLVPLAPLHQPHNLGAIRALAAHYPRLPQVACFDTAFHRAQPHLAQAFALPRTFSDAGLRRYGFHGLSYEYVAATLPRIAPEVAAGRVVVAHLGNGASLCALREGRSVATTMGFTALDGLMMGTRCGALDPGVLLYLMDQRGMDARALEDLLYHRSGLLGVSGISSDMRSLLASADPRAAEAIDLFVYRIARELGSLAAALGGLDALVFTGGIGEHAAAIRSRVCRDAAWLGIVLDEAANRAGGPRISAPGAAASAWVVPTDENRMIALHTARVLGLE